MGRKNSTKATGADTGIDARRIEAEELRRRIGLLAMYPFSPS
jgi:hypothetical protein